MSENRSEETKKGCLVAIIIVLGLIIIIGALVVGGYMFVLNYDVALDPFSTEQINVRIPSGSGTAQIGRILEEKGVIGNAKLFRYTAVLNELDDTFQAGDYVLSPSMTTREIMERIKDGRRDTVRFTIPEGYTLKRVGEKLAQDGFVDSAQDFYAALEDSYDYWFLDLIDKYYDDPSGTVSKRANRLEGYLMPDTYEIYVGSSAHDIIDRMLGGFDAVFTQEYRDRAEELGMTVQEVVSLASLIQSEAGSDAERPVIASVIYNRLKKDMPLQIDASVLYALGEHKDRVLYSDLEIDSPFNTYKNKGLPAGAISAPGKESVKAALWPEETDYYYYVLKGDGSGTHNFAKTSSEFERYKQEYLKSR